MAKPAPTELPGQVSTAQVQTDAMIEERAIGFPAVARQPEVPTTKRADPPENWTAWAIKCKNAGKVAELETITEFEPRSNSEVVRYEWKGEESHPIWLGYPHVRFEAENIGRGGSAEDGGIKPNPITSKGIVPNQGANPTLLTSFPWPLACVASDFKETGCAVFVRADHWNVN